MIDVTPAKAQAARAAIDAAIARKALLEFCSLIYPEFVAAPHLTLLAGLLEQVERGDLRRLLVTLHPGAGKSVLLQAFASWYLGRNPRRKLIAASAGAELAERNSRASRAFFGDPRWPFADVELSKATTAMNRWDTTQGGGLVAIGVGGIITGFRANLFVLDDLQNDALSIGERDALWKWFREVLMPRLEPNGAIVLIQQRWGEDDLPGRIMESSEGGEWRVVRLPAIAEPNDPLGRAAGESLWPERWPLAELQLRRESMGPRAFECAFQGNPVPAEGNLIKAEWLQRYDTPPAEFTKIVCALDSASKLGVRNDYSAIVKIGVARNAFYVLDVWRGKVEFPALLRRVDAVKDDTPAPSTIYVEDTSNATALIQALKQETRLPIVPVTAKGSKESRVEGITGLLEAKKVFFPNEAPWLLDFERELLSFPAGKHDDMVDALVLALSQVQPRRSRAWGFTFGAFGGASEIEGANEEETEWWRTFSRDCDRERAAREAEAAARDAVAGALRKGEA
ncbi:MAG TPA: phage terminase large subunit [Candidatus Cybelea sp.]|jgi:predicted phage terminase large subunit-like protein|nr:phage terminase large subunit [Candidatus Cybelea sp.]